MRGDAWAREAPRVDIWARLRALGGSFTPSLAVTAVAGATLAVHTLRLAYKIWLHGAFAGEDGGAKKPPRQPYFQSRIQSTM